MLLKAQKLDTVGMVKAHEYYQSLPSNVQGQLQNKSNLLHGNMSFLEKSDNRSLLERYLLAATFKVRIGMVLTVPVDACPNHSFNEPGLGPTELPKVVSNSEQFS